VWLDYQRLLTHSQAIQAQGPPVMLVETLLRSGRSFIPIAQSPHRTWHPHQRMHDERPGAAAADHQAYRLPIGFSK
jgi:hypothetical protein